jgi:hypothetical protein
MEQPAQNANCIPFGIGKNFHLHNSIVLDRERIY